MILHSLLLLAAAQSAVPPGEEPVDPYEIKDSNAGATPYAHDRLFAAFHGKEGIGRIVDDLVDRSNEDPRISEIFKAHDMVRLRRTLKEQFCYILGGGCAYTGRDMKSSHRDMGLQTADLNILIEHLQHAMSKEGVPFGAQNKLLAKLAPMKRDIVER